MFKRRISLIAKTVVLLAISAPFAVSQAWFPLNSGTTESLISIHFPKADVGYVFSSNSLLQTKDGGVVWEKSTIPLPVAIPGSFPWQITSGSFPTVDTGYVTAYSYNFSVQTFSGLILKTENGGVDWITVYLGGSSPIHAIGCRSSMACFGGGGGWRTYDLSVGMSFRTLDGGATLSSIPVDAGVFSVHFPSQLIGFILSDNSGGMAPFIPVRVNRTLDGGSNWSIRQGTGLKPANSTLRIRQGFFIDQNTGFAVGDSGMIRKTLNGGDGWIPQVSGTVYNLRWVTFLNSIVGYAVGDRGLILTTTNGGSNWVPMNSGTSAGLSSVVFPTPNIGYVAGAGGTILKFDRTVKILPRQASLKRAKKSILNPRFDFRGRRLLQLEAVHTRSLGPQFP